MKISTFTFLALLLHGGLGFPKIEVKLMKALQRGGTANVFVTMRERTSIVLEGFKGRSFATRGDRITTLVTELQELTTTSQANVISFLEEELSRTGGGWSYESFSIVNQIFIRGASRELVEKLRDFNEIESIAETVGGTTDWTPKKAAAREAEPAPRGWNIERIHAPEVWDEEGNTGAGIVVGIIDSGVRGTHEALRNNFRRSHGWFDYYEGREEPWDDLGQGTHVMGTILGSTGDIGVAPGSQWMACKACGKSGCGLEAFLHCGLWIMCPTDYDGRNRNCSMAPQVVNNAWGFDGGYDLYNVITDAWHIAGIIPVFSAGYDGGSCSSLWSPADYDNVLGVGGTDYSDSLTDWSGVGPSRLTTEFKPDVVAPGAFIYSAGSKSDTDYWAGDCSSWTAPHVAGTVALMLASRSQDRPCFENVRDALRQSSEPIWGQGLSCSGVGDDQRPNYHHGYGLINALGAVRIYKNMTLSCT